MFLGFPRHADNHNTFALAELVDGHLIPFPDKEYVYPSDKPYQDWLVSPHGMYMDKNDVLWIIDDGKRAGIQEIPDGAAKVVGIDIHRKKVVASVNIMKPVMNDESHLNDLRVDLTHGRQGTAYIANSGFGERYSIIVVDIVSGSCRELLINHPSVSPDPGFLAFLEGKPLVFDAKEQRFPLGGADGIALAPDSKRLYWTTISGRKLFSISTDTLSDPSFNKTVLEASIRFEGEHPACDGLAEDEKGDIFFGAFEQQSLVMRRPGGAYKSLLQDHEKLVWPDGLAYRNGYLYVTLGQWNRLPGFNGGKDLRKPPFQVIRVKIPGK